MTSSPLSPWLTEVSLSPRLRARRALASALWRASRWLSRWAERVGTPAASTASLADVPRLEFHAHGAAPEGALYVDGVLFAHLEGVTRL